MSNGMLTDVFDYIKFILAQQVQDIVGKFDDPLEAAKYVVQESFRLWLQYEVRFAILLEHHKSSM